MPSEESMIQDLRELEAELREKEEYRKANIIDLFIKYSTHCKIDRSKVQGKIEEYQTNMKMYENHLSNIFHENDIRQEVITVLTDLLREDK